MTMEIQGEPDQIDRVIQVIETRKYIQIERMKNKDIPLLDGEKLQD